MKPSPTGTHTTLPSSFQTDHPTISNPGSLGIHTCWKLARQLMNCTGLLSNTHLWLVKRPNFISKLFACLADGCSRCQGQNSVDDPGTVPKIFAGSTPRNWLHTLCSGLESASGHVRVLIEFVLHNQTSRPRSFISLQWNSAYTITLAHLKQTGRLKDRTWKKKYDWNCIISNQRAFFCLSASFWICKILL